MTEEFIDIKDDLPCIRKGYTRVTVDVDVITKAGKIIEDCFGDIDGNFYDSHGRKIRNVKGWRTR